MCSIINGVECCGLTIVAFYTDVTWNFAIQNGYFADEGLNICLNIQRSSVVIYDTILASGQAEITNTQIDNALWRRLNYSTPLSLLAGGDGQRGFYLMGNTHVLGGHNGVQDLSNKNIVVDSVDSGFVVGLKKTLYDYGVENYTLIPYGTNRLGIVQQGNLSDTPIAATMQNNIAPYMVDYPVVTLAKQSEHFCPSQGYGYIAYSSWVQNATNYASLVKFLRALLRSYQWQLDPANWDQVKAYIASNEGITDPNKIELQFDDLYYNPATGLNPYLVPKKTGMRNQVSTRNFFGMSPYPAEGIDSFLTSKAGGFIDLRALKDAQASLGLAAQYNYDTESFAGCPLKNTGTYTTVSAPPTCTYTYSISTQPPSWPTGLTASLTISVSNSSLLVVNGQPGWSVQFTANGHGSTPAFEITSSWNNGGITYTTSGNSRTYTVSNAGYNPTAPTGLGWTAYTTLASPYNNICGLSINGVQCAASATSDASTSC